MQAGTLRQTGVDLVSAMTFGSVAEGVGIALAAAGAGLPLSLSFLVDAAGRRLDGTPRGEAVEAVDAETGDARPDFYGINCAHPDEFTPALVDEPWVRRLRGLRAERGHGREAVALPDRAPGLR